MRIKIRVPDQQTADRDARIRVLYEEGRTLAEVAQEVGVHETTAWRVLARAGVVRPRGWKQRQELSPAK
jgi:DNA-binding transcriptional regulator LsrR (DeoR family)